MRLIDADALMKTLGITDMDCAKCAWYSRAYRQCKRGGDFEDACTAIEDAPTVEPQRMRGKWIWKGEEGDSRFSCSVCKCRENVPTCNGIPDIWDYCPNCGCQMNGDEEDEQ